MEWILIYVPPVSLSRPWPYHSFFIGSCIFHKPFKAKEAVFTDPWNTVSHAFFIFLRLFKITRGWEVVKVSQKYVDSPLIYFHLPTWAVYLCSVTVEQPLQAMVCCISVVSYDRYVIHRNFPMICLLWIVVQCVVWTFQYCILGTLQSSFLYRFLRQYKHNCVQCWQDIQGDHNLHINFFV